MSSTTFKLATKTKSKSKLHHYGNNTQKQLNHQNNKKNSNTKNVSTSLRRPMTPSVDYPRYPEPEIILKEIEKNVNVLKEIYEASVSQRNAFKNSEECNMSLSQKVSSQKQSKSSKNSHRNKDAVPEAEIINKKSVPEINFLISDREDKKKKKAFEEKEQEKTKKEGKNLEAKNNLNKSKSHSEENFIKIFEARRKSIANIQKQVETIKNTQNKPFNSTTEQKEDQSCNHLFEIFKFYKRSIDSSISKYSNPLNMHSNDPKNSLFSDHNNYHSIQNKSETKETPHNSSTKIVTNHKGSEIDPSFEGSIEGEVWKENDELVCRKANGVNPRNNDRKIELFKKKTRKDSVKTSRVSSQEEKKRSLKGETKKNQSQKSYNKDLLTKISKDKAIKQEDKVKIQKQKSTESSSYPTSRSKKPTKKKPQLIEFEEITFEKPISESISKKNIIEIQKFDFPEIQSSAFNRDMPILEEDSREELSSSMMIVPGNSINLSKSPQKNRESPLKNEIESEQHYFLANKNSILNQQDIINEEIMKKVQKAKAEFILYSSKNKKVSPEQNTRFPTPSFATSESSNEMMEIELNEKQNLYLNFDNSDGSLAGCEIPKDRNDSFVVEEFETSSFDL